MGLFADQDIDEVNGIIEACGLEYAQLCGSEEPDYWDGVRAKVIKQVRVRPLASDRETVEATLARVKEVVSRGNIALLDSYRKGALGGTGHALRLGHRGAGRARVRRHAGGRAVPGQRGAGDTAGEPRGWWTSPAASRRKGSRIRRGIRAFAEVVRGGGRRLSVLAKQLIAAAHYGGCGSHTCQLQTRHPLHEPRFKCGKIGFRLA